MTDRFRRAGLTVAALLGAGALALAPTVASAHVGVSADAPVAGGYAVLQFSVPHGCSGSATTEIAVQVPEEITAVTPTRNANWTLAVVSEELAEPATDSHGNEVTERVAEVVWTAINPLPEGQRDTFELSVRLPDAAGETLYFPTIQTCEEGEAAWIEIAADGQDPHDLAYPAPAVTIIESDGDAHGHAHGEEASGDHSDVSATGSGADGLSVAALVVGSLGLIAGVVALLRPRKA